ncbi:zinc dependent phospholipase C family protein [Clostridium beijerinckii]|uniref:zinc dependent phospholipase C family protein n=1 Tax=Clostridium beijerinckii TaxID=1520 RepID=UPI000684D3BF|nr:zinc dependent phospholipase C family protein [Clostridium beijerinckii]
MKVKTHVKIAELAFSNSIKVVPNGFSKFMFNFGLVMVDQSWHVKTHPHYRQKSFKYVIEKIEELLSVKRFNGYYSMQLGIVIHYLCDFCCNAHISGSIGNITNHIKYERELQRYLLNNFDNLRNYFIKTEDNKNRIFNSLASIKESIENILEDYMKGKASYLLDIKQCVKITSVVCYNVFAYNESLSRNISVSQYKKVTSSRAAEEVGYS